MENFVDRIIETDRKARELLESARSEKKKLLDDAKKRAADYLEQQEQAVRQGRAAVDEEFSRKTAQAAEEADQDYLEQKHRLDGAFEQHRAAWLSEITQNILKAD